jgi:hypothetical protein
MRKNIASILIILSIVTIFVSDSRAIIIGPARLEVRLPRGEIADIYYYAQNDTEAPIHVLVEPENWAKGAYDYGNLSIKDWISMDCYEFDLKPKEIKKIKLTIKVPKDAKGELVAQIFFTSSALSAHDKSSSGIRSRLGGVLYVAVKGTEKAAAEIHDIAITRMNEDKPGKMDIAVKVRNSGNVHIRPASGFVAIEDKKGQRIARIDMNTEHSVLPGIEYTYTERLSNGPELKEGKYRISSEIKYGKMYGREKTARFAKDFEVDGTGKVAAQ